MSVSIDYQPSGHEGGPRRRSRRGLLIAVVIGVVALVLALLVTRGKHGSGDPGGTPSSSSPTTSVTALPRGPASSTGASAKRLVSGKPRGFPHTELGAVEAATTYMASAYDIKRMPKADRVAYIKDVTGQQRDTGEAAAAAFKTRYYLNDQGQPVGPATRLPDPNVTFTSACYPALGAYQVRDATTNQVSVEVWMPCVVGNIIKQGKPDLEVSWTQGIAQMTWKGRDWLATGGSPTQLIKPPNANRVALPYTQRAQLLGAGWVLYSDASEAMPPELAALGELQ